MDKKSDIKWYDNAGIITSLIIGIIALIILASQSFAVSGESSLALFGSVINHNSIYLLVVIYFIVLKTYFGKRYFNYINLILVFLYLLATCTSFLTVIQSFSLNTVVTFAMNFVIVIYLIHTMFRDTRIWSDYKMGNSPFNELSNDWYFYTLVVLSLFLLAINLVSTVVIGGVVISVLDSVYIMLFARYIYLYRNYLDSREIDADNDGNFDAMRENIKNTVDEVSNKVNEFVEKNEIDERIDEIKDKVVEGTNEIREKVSDLINDDKEIKKKDLGTSKEKKASKSKKSSSKKKVDDKKKEDSK